MTAQSHRTTPTRRSRSSNLADNPVLTFVPWIIFWIVAGPRTWEVASGCALLASLLLILLDVGRPILERALTGSAGLSSPSGGRQPQKSTPKMLDLGTSVFFLALVIIGFFVDRQSLIGLEKYSQAISSGALCLIVVLSIALGHPFTEQYARQGVPEAVWHTPLFRRTMVVMSSVWAGIFAVMAILGLISETGVTGAGSSDLLNWYIPIGLVIAGFKFNEWYPSYIQQLAAEQRGHEPTRTISDDYDQ
ncbi:MAG: hypothetical protein JO372_10120 [Solirubrobacterales bacterium]|nr:hypothetical protein [Solirubrobacterales bacterium]